MSLTFANDTDAPRTNKRPAPGGANLRALDAVGRTPQELGDGLAGAASGPRLVDLRSELGTDAPAIERMRHPLPARLVQLTPGNVRFEPIDPQADSFGLLVLDGLLLAELEAGRAHTAWLVGPHDLIRPSVLHEFALTEQTRWRALARTRMALLDNRFGLIAGGIPLVSRVLLNRAVQTSSWLLAKSLLLSSPLIEERLLLLFGLLGERWGKVTAEGVLLSLPLTHAMLAGLCGARRPSVTVGIRSLERAGLLTCNGRGTWLLRRDPRDGGEYRLSSSSHYERSLGLTWAEA